MKASPPQSVPADLTTSEAIDGLLTDIRRPRLGATLEDALELGKLVVDRLYQGDLEAFRVRGKSQPSFKALSLRTDLKVSAVSLFRAVALYELSARLGPLSQWPNLGAAHFRTVIGLKDATQIELLDQAAAGGWSVRKVESQASERRPKGGPGRRKLPGFVRTIRKLERMVPEGSLEDTERLVDMAPADLRAVHAAVVEMRTRLSALERTLRNRLPASQAPVVPMRRPPSGVFTRVVPERRLG